MNLNNYFYMPFFKKRALLGPVVTFIFITAIFLVGYFVISKPLIPIIGTTIGFLSASTTFLGTVFMLAPGGFPPWLPRMTTWAVLFATATVIVRMIAAPPIATPLLPFWAFGIILVGVSILLAYMLYLIAIKYDQQPIVKL